MIVLADTAWGRESIQWANLQAKGLRVGCLGLTHQRQEELTTGKSQSQLSFNCNLSPRERITSLAWKASHKKIRNYLIATKL